MNEQMLNAVRTAFDAAAAWGLPTPDDEPPKSLAVTFRRPEDPAGKDARFRYYLPAGETLAFLARRAGCQEPSAALLVLREEADQTGPLVTVRVILAPAEA